MKSLSSSVRLASVAVIAAIFIVLGLYVFLNQSQGQSLSSTNHYSNSNPPQVTISQLRLTSITCSGLPGCQPVAQLTGVISVSAGSPLSCIEVSANGTSDGSTCFNVSATAFTSQTCSGSGAQASCSLIIQKGNTNTLTMRTLNYSHVIQGNVISIQAGKTYSIVLVMRFEDGASATISSFLVAT
jgi:hypothetical protein